MTFEEIYNTLLELFGENTILSAASDIAQPMITVEASMINEVCKTLHTHPAMLFDMLSCITCIDNDVKEGTLEVLYHLYSIPFECGMVLQLFVSRDLEKAPVVPSISDVWLSADWHEREIFDLFGLPFSGHKDLRRILLPADWDGHPLRKDYKEAEKYHGLTIITK